MPEAKNVTMHNVQNVEFINNAARRVSRKAASFADKLSFYQTL